MRIGQYKLANVFLTCTNQVGMQWGLVGKTANMTDTFTIWREGNVLRNSSTHAVPLPVLKDALLHYNRNAQSHLHARFVA